MKKVIIPLVCVLLILPTVGMAADFDINAQAYQVVLDEVSKGTPASFYCTYVDSENLLLVYGVFPGFENLKQACDTDPSARESWETFIQLMEQIDKILYEDVKAEQEHSMVLLVSTPDPVDSLEALLLAGYDVLAASKDGALIYNVAE